VLTLDDIKNIVDTNQLDRLIGEVENQFFDAKGFPYQFDSGMDAKREFAKDVAAFANAGGGYIFIGAATKTSVVLPAEEVEELRPIPHSLFNADQHLSRVEEGR
jgi:predicted HTH transcriptional regulator